VDDSELGTAVREERRRFLEQSLADADAEYLAGDLSDRDYLALRRRDMARLATIGSAKVASGATGRSTPPRATQPASTGTGVLVSDPDRPTDAPDHDTGVLPAGEHSARRGRSRRSWWFLGAAVAAFGAALVLSVTLFTSSRQPGQSATGSFAQTQQQQLEETLAQAANDENQGDLGQAADLYQSVLAKHPTSEVALAQLGWLEVETGQQGKSASLIDDGRAKLNRAVQLAPGDYAVRLYLGTVLLQQNGDAAGAVGEYRRFLADNPPPSVLEQAAPVLRKAYQAAWVPVPAQVPAN
jgi:tetratricopeptide (TPR) repeat protein